MPRADPGESGLIDRIAPTRRPPRRAVIRQKWRDLLFLHWEVPAEVLRPLVPPPLDIDRFDGRAYVGLVPFTMTGVRPVGLPPVPGFSSFHETNVRTYVHRAGRDPGVWFFSLDAASRLAVDLARKWFHLPYSFARLFLEHQAPARPGDPQPIVYAGDRHRRELRPASYVIRATPTGPVSTAPPGSLEHFLVERYLLYSLTHGSLYQGQVHHNPYPLQNAVVHSCDENLLLAAGLPRPDDGPLPHFSRGVDVEVFAIQSPGKGSPPASRPVQADL